MKLFRRAKLMFTVEAANERGKKTKFRFNWSDHSLSN
jgi:hypothetical protein